ncbi:MAG TPA: PCRF domain-containing protein, partial [Dissulfurispiraceae bacterium]|nr:PCRF domain-containing protein [Dissulfurispiraceae bacterium]
MWSSPDKIKELQKAKAEILETMQPVESFLDKVHSLEELSGLLNEEGGEIFLEEFKKELDKLKQELDDMELKILLSGEMDKNNA